MDLILILIIVLLFCGGGWGFHSGFGGPPGIVVALLVIILVVYLLRGRGTLLIALFLSFAALWVSGCSTSLASSLAAYNSHVAARSDSISGYSKDSSVGGAYTHTVQYR